MRSQKACKSLAEPVPPPVVVVVLVGGLRTEYNHIYICIYIYPGRPSCELYIRPVNTALCPCKAEHNDCDRKPWHSLTLRTPMRSREPYCGAGQPRSMRRELNMA